MIGALRRIDRTGVMKARSSFVAPGSTARTDGRGLQCSQLGRREAVGNLRSSRAVTPSTGPAIAGLIELAAQTALAGTRGRTQNRTMTRRILCLAYAADSVPGLRGAPGIAARSIAAHHAGARRATAG
jgi:hypothetical protein